MSEVKVNKISPRSGTGVQLGDSGDTINLPSGATFAYQTLLLQTQLYKVQDKLQSTVKQ